MPSRMPSGSLPSRTVGGIPSGTESPSFEVDGVEGDNAYGATTLEDGSTFLRFGGECLQYFRHVFWDIFRIEGKALETY
jgi:hypothetical protein